MLAGVAAAWTADAGNVRPASRRLVVACAALAALPDADLILPGAHRTATHSFTAVFVVFIIAASVTGQVTRWRTAAVCAAAYASHLLLDWLGDDRSVPIGIRALWPFTDAYFQSELRWFPPVERRYWLPGFWTANLRAIGWEMLVLMPLAAMAMWVRARQTGSAARVRTPRRAQRRE